MNQKCQSTGQKHIYVDNLFDIPSWWDSSLSSEYRRCGVQNYAVPVRGWSHQPQPPPGRQVIIVTFTRLTESESPLKVKWTLWASWDEQGSKCKIQSCHPGGPLSLSLIHSIHWSAGRRVGANTSSNPHYRCRGAGEGGRGYCSE